MKKAAAGFIFGTIILCALTSGLLLGMNLNHSKITLQETANVSDPIHDSETAPQNSGVKININSASVEELTMLPGIGPVLAERIVDYRTTVGPFRKTTDLCNVKGIGEKMLLKLLDYISV